jgi:protein TonB
MKKLLLISVFLLLIISVKAQYQKPDPSDIDKIDIKEPVDSSKSQNTEDVSIIDASVTEDYNTPQGDPHHRMGKGDKEPMFPGGRQAFLNYIGRKIRIPKKNFIEGIVRVSFVIDRDGSLVDPKIIDGSVTEVMKEEIFRVILACPAWQAGIQNNRAVRVLYTMPITFKQ